MPRAVIKRSIQRGREFSLHLPPSASTLGVEIIDGEAYLFVDGDDTADERVERDFAIVAEGETVPEREGQYAYSRELFVWGGGPHNRQVFVLYEFKDLAPVGTKSEEDREPMPA